jgi:MerC mercury resistance protein
MSVPSQALPGWLGQWQPRLDALGALASGLCAAHCVLVPLAVALMPYAGWQALESSAFDAGFVAFATLFGAVALGAGTCRHRLRWTAPMYVVSVSMLVCGLLASHQGWLHAVLLALGGALMALTHLLNRHALRHHGCVPLRLFGTS